MHERMCAVYEAFIERVPYENLSNNRAVREHPEDPDSWPRATDRLLRENQTYGLGGTSFSLSYALRDILHGAGGNAHTTLGYNLVTERAHAAVIVYVDGEPWLFDPALLLCGPIPVRPGGYLDDPLGRFVLLPRCGPTLTVALTLRDELKPAPPVAADDAWAHVPLSGTEERPIYSIIPIPAAPHNFRQAWLASFFRGRRMPLRLACRAGNEIIRYGERPGSIEIMRMTGREVVPAPEGCSELLHNCFGIERECLDEWFQARQHQRP